MKTSADRLASPAEIRRALRRPANVRTPSPAARALAFAAARGDAGAVLRALRAAEPRDVADARNALFRAASNAAEASGRPDTGLVRSRPAAFLAGVASGLVGDGSVPRGVVPAPYGRDASDFRRGFEALAGSRPEPGDEARATTARDEAIGPAGNRLPFAGA